MAGGDWVWGWVGHGVLRGWGWVWSGFDSDLFGLGSDSENSNSDSDSFRIGFSTVQIGSDSVRIRFGPDSIQAGSGLVLYIRFGFGSRLARLCSVGDRFCSGSRSVLFGLDSLCVWFGSASAPHGNFQTLAG